MTRSRLISASISLAIVVITVSLASTASPAERGNDRNELSPADHQAAWQGLKAMVGVWKGTDDGGSATIEQRYEMVIGGRFLHARTMSVSEAETHEDWEIYSFDGVNKKLMLRQFTSEGYVNRYALDKVADDGRTLVFLAEACENAPPAFRTRQTLRFEDGDHVAQVLELAPSGKNFKRCAGNRLERQP